MANTREVPSPSWADIFGLSGEDGGGLGEEHSILTGSGKASIALVLSYLRSIGFLHQKTDKILMPQWLGYWVYNQVNEFAQPVFCASDTVRIVMPYHQYGFPQKMGQIMDYANSIGAHVVEDCAHSLWMEQAARPQSCSSNFQIYSYSKFFYCHALGGVTGGGSAFREFIKDRYDEVGESLSRFNNVVKLLHELYLSNRLPNYRLWDNLLSMSYALYGRGLRPLQSAIRLMQSKLASEIDCRRRRYAYFRDQFRALETERYLGDYDIAPYVIPLLLPELQLHELVKTLRSNGYQTGIYNFDTNRNLLDPKFEKVMWLLLHRGMSDSEYERQLNLVAGSI